MVFEMGCSDPSDEQSKQKKYFLELFSDIPSIKKI